MAIVDTGLTSRAVIGRFYRRLEEAARAAWWTRLAMRFTSAQETETYRWLGAVPQVREWEGARRITPLPAGGITLANRVWEATLRVDADELRRDKSGQIMVRVHELAQRVAAHPNALLSELISNGPTTNCYDGTPFFGSTHAEGSSGTQANEVDVNVATPAAPTDTEMRGAILAAITQMLRILDNQGEPMNENARAFLVMVPVSLLPATLGALISKLVDSTENPLAFENPFRIEWYANPRLAWTDQFAVFRTDADTRPFIFQEELPVQVQALAEGSELEINENQHQYGVKAIHAAGYGFWQSACLVNLT